MAASDSLIPDFQKLLGQACAGNDDAFGQLLENYRPWLRALARRWLDGPVGRRLDASDVVQQTCLSALRHREKFAGTTPGEFLAWLRAIHERNLQNAVRDHALTGKRAVSAEVVLESGLRLSVECSSPSQRILQNETAVALASVLERLPDDQAEALRLRYFEGCTLVEVAQQMQRSQAAAAGLLKRGLSRLRVLLPEGLQ